MIVLRLHFEEAEPYIHIGTHTDLLSLEMAHLMTLVHGTVGRVEVERIVGRGTVAVDLLHEVVVAGQPEEAAKHGHGGDELGVDAVHEPYRPHLVERDRVVLV